MTEDSKTPEQMAEEWAHVPRADQDMDECDLTWDNVFNWEVESFLAGYQAAKPQWISVKERLPEDVFENTIVLVWRAGWHDYDTVRWKSRGFYDVNPETITYWMPLPEPPKGK